MKVRIKEGWPTLAGIAYYIMPIVKSFLGIISNKRGINNVIKKQKDKHNFANKYIKNLTSYGRYDIIINVIKGLQKGGKYVLN